MDEALGVHGGERAADPQAERDALGRRQPFSREADAQVSPSSHSMTR